MKRTSRRVLLRTVGVGLASLGVAGCAPESSAGDPKASGSPGCLLTPEGTEGPYYLDLDMVRRDITEGRPGVALHLTTTVVGAQTCEPIPDAAVDIWHADATGIYSGFSSNNSEGERFLRGVQITDAAGTAQFDTIYPGWYDGRTIHIHIKVHVEGNVAHTGQLYFDEAVNSAVAEWEPYAGNRTRDTFNEDDMFYPRTGAQSTLTITGSAEDGHRGEITVGVQT